MVNFLGLLEFLIDDRIARKAIRERMIDAKISYPIPHVNKYEERPDRSGIFSTLASAIYRNKNKSPAI